MERWDQNQSINIIFSQYFIGILFYRYPQKYPHIKNAQMYVLSEDRRTGHQYNFTLVIPRGVPPYYRRERAVHRANITELQYVK